MCVYVLASVDGCYYCNFAFIIYAVIVLVKSVVNVRTARVCIANVTVA